MSNEEKNIEEITETTEATEITETTEATEATNTTEATEPVEKIEEPKKEKPKKEGGKLKALFKSRKLKKGGLSIAFTALFIVVVIIINMIAGLVTTRVPALTFDLSSTGTYGLSQDTIDFVETVNKDVKITVLASESTYTSASEYYLKANTLLKQYKNYNSKIKIEYVDLTANPAFVNKYPNDSLSGGSYIVSCGDKYRILTNEDLFETQMTSDYSSYEIVGLDVEPAVTTAILNVTSENQIKIQFVDGYGEYSADKFKNLLEQNNYDISSVSLLTEDIDSNTEALLLYMPTVDIDETAAKKIRTYLNNNGNYGKSLIYVACPEKIETPNIDTLLEEWGMQMENGVTAEYDTSKLFSQSPYLSILDYNNTDFTDGLKDSTLSIIGGYNVPVTIKNENIAKSLLVTSTSAKLFPFDADENFDIEGQESKQFNVAAIGTQTSNDGQTSNVVVCGSSILFSDNAISMSSANNGAYIINMFNKLTENTDEGITIDGKDLSNPSLGITTDQINGITTVCIVIIPLAIIIVAIVIWVRRRNR